MHILGGQLLCTPLCSQDFSDTQGQKDAVKLQGTHALNKTLRVIRKIQRARGFMYMYCGKYEVTNALAITICSFLSSLFGKVRHACFAVMPAVIQYMTLR